MIEGDSKIGTYAVKADGSLGGMIRAFGQPARLRRTGEACAAIWPSHGLAANFYNLPGQNPCAPKSGRFSRALMHGSRWRTAVGLRIGMASSAVKRYHPRATFRRGMRFYWPAGWWLVTRVSLAGARSTYPGLHAETRAGKVVAFQVRYPAGGD